MTIKLPPVPRATIGENYEWREWFTRVQNIFSTVKSVTWSLIDFTGSDLADIATRMHSSLQNVAGGTYHLAANEYYSLSSVVTVTSNYAATATDGYIYVDTTSGNITITLPASSADGKVLEVIKTVVANTLTVIPTGTDTVVGDTSVIVYTRYTALTFKAVTGGWILV